ncbi:MAG: 3-oxoadipate enol-lactonase [Rhodocyclaceae bacterium]|jgi:3-oxoadipate enol-lactonase|nr:3-oxoadipate enol-lactonase [Rhodocyclaceae bacterium]
MKVRANGIDIHYEVSGSGPWLTLSHSLCCDVSMWQPQLAALEKRFTVLRFDTRGHGGTDAPAGAYTFDQLADDVLGLLDALQVERTHFCGLSMGGMIGQHLALKAPQRIDRLVLADTTSRMPAEAQPLWAERIRVAQEKGMGAHVQPTLERWFTASWRAVHPEVMEAIGNLIRNTPVAGYVGCAQTIARIDVTDRLSGIKAPTLVIVGRDDLGTPPAMSEAIAAAIPGARLAVIPEASHLSNIEQADAFNRLLLDFLTE